MPTLETSARPQPSFHSFGGHPGREGSIALVTNSLSRVRQFTDLLASTSFAAHQIVWMPTGSALLTDDTGSRFDAVLWDAENREVSARAPSLPRILAQNDSLRVITVGAGTQDSDRSLTHLSSLNLTTARLEKALHVAGVQVLPAGHETAFHLSAA